MSVKAEASITIDRPPEAVFAVITDVAHHPDWSKGAGRILDVSENPAALGTTWTQITKMMGREIQAQARVNEYEANRKFGSEVDKPFPAQLLWVLEPAGSGCTVTVTAESEPTGFYAAAGPLMAKAIRDSFSSDLNSLKAHLETPA
jgi:uncharacterized protein YndB with AHSA1/START domain